MPFGSLWLPVIVSAVVVFVGSSLMHMLLTYHKADHKRLPDEDAVRAALAKAAPAPGTYFTPHCKDHKEINEPAVKEKFENGPVAIVTVLPNGAPMMPKHLALWFGFTLIVSFTAAYVARHTLAPGADGMLVMRVVGSVAFAAYGIAPIVNSIWKGQPWANTVREILDGGVYTLLTGVVFRLLWPSA